MDLHLGPTALVDIRLYARVQGHHARSAHRPDGSFDIHVWNQRVLLFRVSRVLRNGEKERLTSLARHLCPRDGDWIDVWRICKNEQRT